MTQLFNRIWFWKDTSDCAVGHCACLCPHSRTHRKCTLFLCMHIQTDFRSGFTFQPLRIYTGANPIKQVFFLSRPTWFCFFMFHWSCVWLLGQCMSQTEHKILPSLPCTQIHLEICHRPRSLSILPSQVRLRSYNLYCDKGTAVKFWMVQNSK